MNAPLVRARATRMRPARWTALLLGALVLTGCGTTGAPGSSTGPGTAASTAPSASDSSPATASATPTESGTGSPSPGATGSPTPGSAGPSPSSSLPSTTGGATPDSTAAPASCAQPTPVRVEKAVAAPRRTTEVVSVVSDGKSLTSGTREQSDFAVPTLVSPEGASVTDAAAVQKVASIVAATGKNRLLLRRPDSPDATADASRKPFDTPGTYVLYNASSPLSGDVVVQCDGQEQRWTFTAEADPTSGQVNCAVEPPKTNALARQVYGSNC